MVRAMVLVALVSLVKCPVTLTVTVRAIVVSVELVSIVMGVLVVVTEKAVMVIALEFVRSPQSVADAQSVAAPGGRYCNTSPFLRNP